MLRCVLGVLRVGGCESSRNAGLLRCCGFEGEGRKVASEGVFELVPGIAPRRFVVGANNLWRDTEWHQQTSKLLCADVIPLSMGGSASLCASVACAHARHGVLGRMKPDGAGVKLC
jgi:hypothetical protein